MTCQLAAVKRLLVQSYGNVWESITASTEDGWVEWKIEVESKVNLNKHALRPLTDRSKIIPVHDVVAVPNGVRASGYD